MVESMFIKGKVYSRKEIHDQYGGNRQRGISASAKHPYIFIFSGDSGKQYGYIDGWTSEGYYRYTGEGQTGDQVFSYGNKALLNHIDNKKKVFLFKKKQNGYHFEGELELMSTSFETNFDVNQFDRKIIIFKFKLLD